MESTTTAVSGQCALMCLTTSKPDPSGSEIDTVCIVTTMANGATAAIHDRMPAIIDAEDFEAWLNPDETVPPPLGLLRPAPDDAIEFFAIGPHVNRATNDVAEVQTPAL